MLVIATILYWLAVMTAAVVLAVVFTVRVVLEGADAVSSLEDLKWLGIGLGAVAVIAAIVGSIIAAVRLPLQRRRLERQVLTESGAGVVTGGTEDHRRVRNLLEGLAIAADIPPPRFAVVEDPAPNSFAVGTRPKRAIVAVTRGAIDSLARDELEAVLAYEVSRIGSWDVALSSWTVALTGAAMGALDDDVTKLFGAVPFWASRRLRRWALRDTALDRDRAAVRFTRNPAGLLRALVAMRDNPLEVQRVSAATAPLWLEVPSRLVGGGVSLDDRIAALAELGGG
jgi:heat shock protein HtpX